MSPAPAVDNKTPRASGSASLIFLLLLNIAVSCKHSSQHADASPWYSNLPKCPCQNPDLDSIRLQDGWARDIGNIAKYHAGAHVCFRSYPAIATTKGLSGQQCCYDQAGWLIPCGSGAGTPDMVCTCLGEDEKGVMRLKYSAVFGHWKKDILPWELSGGRDSGWLQYNLVHPPDTGVNCH